MQLRLPWTTAPARPRPPSVVVVDGHTFPVDVVRHRRARRYLLRVTEDGRLRLTVPRGASTAAGIRFVETQHAWIAGEWARHRQRSGWRDGSTIWWRGEPCILRIADGWAWLGELALGAVESGSGTFPGAGHDLRRLVQARLRALAAPALVARCRALGEAGGLMPRSLVVRNQRTRWGSCSSRGVISLNWRLAQMPPPVADYVMHHELAHLVHPDHSRRFWRAVERLCPEWRAAEHWLRRHGRELL